MRILLTLCLALLLGACSKGDKQTFSVPASWSTESLTYAYPYNGQTMIAPTAPVVLHFSNALTETDTAVLASKFKLTNTSTGADVPFTLTRVDEGRGVTLQPTAVLVEKASFTIEWSDLAITGGDLVKPVPLSFSTRPANRGPASLIKEGAFAVARRLPSQADFPLMDFSSLRLQFTQPVEAKSAVYGQSVQLLDKDGALVPVRLLVNGPLMTIDPVADLTPGASYMLQLTSALQSRFGEALTPGAYAAFNFTPLDSKPRATTALSVPTTAILSPLTGKAINNVPIQSRLLGNDSASQQGGNLFAELAFVPHFPNATPLRVARGNFLSGQSVNVMIVGKVPAGMNTGAISVNVISDANGYMVANPYTSAVDAPRQVFLTMDVAMAAANAPSNGAFTQNILHVEVVGTAIVKQGQLTMDAVGVVELDVLGLDQAAGVLSFHLEGYQDINTAPKPVVDTVSPFPQSMLPDYITPASSSDPAPVAKRARPGDPIIVNFNEPLDASSLAQPGAISLLKNGVAEPFDWRADGAAVVIQPQATLAYGATYQVQFSTQATDLAGNPLSDSADASIKLDRLRFAMPAYDASAARAPIPLTSYPGYPCATTGRNIAANQQGRCVGGQSGDDILPILSLAADRSLKVVFSQSMNPTSIKLGSSCGAAASFRVETLDASGTCTGVVTGRLVAEAQTLRFTPDDLWVDGQLYRYVLGSNGNHLSATATCDGSSAICGSNGLPLQTRSLGSTLADTPVSGGGGPNLEIVFRGTPVSSTVFQTLRSLPASDVNANFIHEASEEGPETTGSGLSAVNGAVVSPRSPSGSGSVTAANVGCPVGESCPANQFVYLTSALDAEVGEYDPSLGGVRVLIHPTRMMASSFDTYVTVSAPGVTPNNPSRSGTQVMRLRYALEDPSNAGSPRTQLITGLIVETPAGPVLKAELDGYIDTPELDPTVTFLAAPVHLSHNVRSYPVKFKVSGPVSFLPDGRMLTTLSNELSVDVNIHVVALNVMEGDIFLTIPAGTMQIQGVSAPIKQ